MRLLAVKGFPLYLALLLAASPGLLTRAQDSETNATPALAASPGMAVRPQPPTTNAPGTTSPAISPAASLVQAGRDLGTKGDVNAAINDFNNAIKADPNYAPAYYNRGFGEMLQGKFDLSLADYTKAISLDPNNTDAYTQRGALRARMGDYDGAESDFAAAIKIAPTMASAYYDSGHVLYFQNKLDDAISQLSQSIKLEPNSFFSYFVRGLAYNAQGDRSDAASDFKKSADLSYPYGALWAWAAMTANHQDGIAHEYLENEMADQKLFPDNRWPTPIASYLVGKLTEDDLITIAKSAQSPQQQTEWLCEAWFFVGISHRFSGDNNAAKDAFTMAVKTNSKQSEEYIEASRVLAQLSEQ